MRVRDGYCGCGCGERLPVPYDKHRNRLAFEAGRRRFVRESHRQRQYRVKLRRLAEAQGFTAPLSLKTVQGSTGTRDRSGDAQAGPRKRQGKPRKGLSIYLPTVQDAERLAEWIDHLRVGPDATTELEPAAQAISRALDRHARKAA